MSKGGSSAGVGRGQEDVSGPGDEEEVTLEMRLRRLDEIVAVLEGGDVELETGLTLFEEGVRHIREAEGLLSRAELRVEELVGDVPDLGTKPLDRSEE